MLQVRGLRLEVKREEDRGFRPEGRVNKMNQYIFPFEKLDVYQMAVDLAEKVLAFLDELPKNRHVRLLNQMEAAATSPAQNITEGKGRQYKKEFIQFLPIAEGSVYEVVTLNEIFRRRKLFSDEESNEVRTRCEQIDRKINGLINSLRGNKRKNPMVVKMFCLKPQME